MFLSRRFGLKVKVFCIGDDSYKASATDDRLTVYNCFGTTKEAAKEMALFQLRKFQEEVVSKNPPKAMRLEDIKLPEGFRFHK